MANIKLTLPGEPFTKQIVTFTAPCDCASVTNGLVINGQTYTVCDAMGNCVTGKGGAWCSGATVSVALDVEAKKAYVQNAATSGYLETKMERMQDAIDDALDTLSRIMIPTPAAALTYTGSAQSPTWTDYDSSKMTIGGTTSATAAGTYTATFTPKGIYKWSDGTATAKSVSWTINKATLAIPSQSGSLSYTGSAQSPSWNNYNSSKMTLGGTTSGTNAGSYNATFTPKTNYQWSDGSTTAKTVAWTIGKVAGSVSLSATSVTVDYNTTSKTVTVTRSGDGAITVKSSNTSVATVSVSGTTVTIKWVDKTGVASATATITVSVAAGTNHNATSATIAVTSKYIPDAGLALNEYSWKEISRISSAGLASSYFSVGDSKTITINGNVGNTTFSNLSIDAFIIGIDHNSAYEGTKKIHFKIGKINGRQRALVDSMYEVAQVSTAGYFSMNTSAHSNGGWKDSYMRNTLLGNTGTPTSPPSGSLMSALPSDLRAVMKSVSKYTNNVGGGSTSTDASCVTATTDYLFLLGFYEYFSTTETVFYINKTEAVYQSQYEYYSTGNPKRCAKHTGDTSDYCETFTRTPATLNTGTAFHAVNTVSADSCRSAAFSEGMAPAFCV